MKKLSYETLKEQNYSGYLLENAPERVLQRQDSTPRLFSASRSDQVLPT